MTHGRVFPPTFLAVGPFYRPELPLWKETTTRYICTSLSIPFIDNYNYNYNYKYNNKKTKNYYCVPFSNLNSHFHLDSVT
jgi:hypothetical protein